MKISKSYLKIEDEYPSSMMEITDREITKNKQKSAFNSRFCRQVLPLESRSHRNHGKINHSSFTAPKVCKLGKDNYSEMAFSVLQYQLKDRKTRQTHINNLKRNLERRIQLAKSQGNHRLVALLTQEFREIASL